MSLARQLPVALLLAASLGSATRAHAHHGVATVGIAGPEGPGAPLETTSPMPLPQSTGFAMLKTEFVSFEPRAHAQPENKDFSSFTNLGLGFGIRPWLSAYLFQPFNVKSQDGVGRNAGIGDTSLMLALGLKWDEGLRRVPERESLDELGDWHFSLWLSGTLPLGSTEQLDRAGQRLAPDMQTGFGKPSLAGGLAALKQLSEDFTWLAEANYQGFFTHPYSVTRYRFGGETRLNTALVYRLWGRGQFRADLSAELGGLHLQRDREQNEAGEMEALRASGGAILYGGLGLRASYAGFAAGLGARRAVLKVLNEEAEQQGSEGLEAVRVALTLSYSRAF